MLDLDLENIGENLQKIICSKIKNDGRKVIIYGAGEIAELVYDLLIVNGIKPYAFAVDSKYYIPGSYKRGLPVIHYNSENEEYLYLLGIGNSFEVVQKFMNESPDRMALTSYCTFAPMDRKFVEENMVNFQELYSLLEDNLSKETLKSYLKLKLSGDIRHNFNVVRKNQYYNEITNVSQGGTYVDCGAYTGDSIKEFIDWSGGKYKKIFAFEPDVNNYYLMKNRLKEFNNIEYINSGSWSTKGILKFSSGNGSLSSIDLTGEIEINVDSIDNVVNERVDFIKMDIEGAELESLKGAKNTICMYYPVLAIAVYHKTDDLITIPKYIKSLENGEYKYKFYLRKHNIADELELDLYAIPEKII